MTKALVLIIGLAFSSLAQAQIKCWTGANGKRACGDVPPPGVTLEMPRGAPAPKAQEIRKSPAESRETAGKTPVQKSAPIGNAQDCERAKEQLGAMHGGGRSKRTDAVRARALFANNCV